MKTIMLKDIILDNQNMVPFAMILKKGKLIGGEL